jgi:hypothetical protein
MRISVKVWQKPLKKVKILLCKTHLEVLVANLVMKIKKAFKI